jgi:aminobenzoyl-glutamate utilization protein A
MKMHGSASELGLPLPEQLVAIRRDLHRHAEPGWCEFRTSSKIIRALEFFGWNVRYGRDVVEPDARMGVPSGEELEKFYRRALETGADPKVVNELRGGFTGVVASLKGSQPGPNIALRFDMDANFGTEASTPDHVPAKRGFSSTNPGVHHNCGHDGHVSMGLGVARVLAGLRQRLQGDVRLIFQPAEEGLRGAAAMIAAGALENVEYFLGGHVGVQALKLGEVIPGYRNILASVKIDATFRGVSAHAAISPHVGRNALLAACVATQNLFAIPRHGDGETRVNVGLLSGGDARNAIAASASLSAELRADTTAILNDLEARANDTLRGAALMHGVGVETSKAGTSCAASSDPEMVELIANSARRVAGVTHIKEVSDFKASDDVAAMMAAVQSKGGRAVYFGLGTDLKAVHHSPYFDFDERALPIGVGIFVEAVQQVGALH